MNDSSPLSDMNFNMNNPAGIWCKNDVVLTLMRRDDVASTLIRRHFRTKCPLGTFATFADMRLLQSHIIVRFWVNISLIMSLQTHIMSLYSLFSPSTLKSNY